MNIFNSLKNTINDTVHKVQQKSINYLFNEPIQVTVDPITIHEVEHIQVQENIEDIYEEPLLNMIEFNDFIIKENNREYKEILTGVVEINEIMNMLKEYSNISSDKIKNISNDVEKTSNNAEKGLKEIVDSDSRCGFF